MNKPVSPSAAAPVDLIYERSLIGGQWVGEPFTEVVDPSSGEVVARVPHLGEAEATAAVEAAHAAFPAWSKTPAKQRAAILRRWFDLIMQHQEALAVLMTREQGKPLAEARGEIDYAASFIEFYAEEAKRLYGETIPSHRADARIMVTKQPVGVAAAITPWNFPAAMLTRKAGPALAAGCTMVVKPAPETPLTALALAALAQQAGLPPGVLNIVTGDAVAIGLVLTTHPLVQAFSFTGSTEVGKLLMRQCASTVKKVGLELGGNAPFIVFDDADIEAAVEGAMVAKYRNMGQTCVCANRIYVQDAVHDRFLDAFAKAVGQLKVGDGRAEGVTQGPLINARAVDKIERHIADAVGQGAQVVTGGRRHPLGGGFFEPTVLSGATADMLVTREETFGPLAPVYRFTDEAEVIDLANATPYGLAAYLYSRDLGRVFRVSEGLDYGMVAVNTGALSTELAPFGGMKQSGLGREGSRHGLEDYIEIKYTLLAGL